MNRYHVVMSIHVFPLQQQTTKETEVEIFRFASQRAQSTQAEREIFKIVKFSPTLGIQNIYMRRG